MLSFSILVVFKVLSLEKQRQHHLGPHWKCPCPAPPETYRLRNPEDRVQEQTLQATSPLQRREDHSSGRHTHKAETTKDKRAASHSRSWTAGRHLSMNVLGHQALLSFLNIPVLILSVLSCIASVLILNMYTCMRGDPKD